MPTLVKMSSNYADEFDVEGFFISLDSKEQIIDMMKHNYMQQVLDRVDINNLDISDEEMKLYDIARWKNKACTIHISKDGMSELLAQSLTVGFGTNEDLHFEDFDHYVAEHTIEEITKDEFDTIQKLFGRKYGHAPDFSPYSRITIKVIE